MGRPGSGPRGTRKREKPVARWTGAFFLLGVCSGAPPPLSLGERKKRRVLARPHQVRDQHSVGYAFFQKHEGEMHATEHSSFPFVPAQAGTQTFERPVCLGPGPRLRGDERREAADPPFASPTFFRITGSYEQETRGIF